MTSIVLVHIGDRWPSHIKICINQIIKFFEGDIYVVSNIPHKIQDCPLNIRYVNSSELRCDSIIEFEKANFFKEYGLNNFWSYAFERLLLLGSLLLKHNIEKVVHIENDVLLYHDPNHVNFRKFFSDRVAFNPLGPNVCTASYVYIDTPRAMTIINDLLINLIKKGKEELLRMLPGNSMINEMILLSHLQSSKDIDYLPINMEGMFSDNYGDFNMIFDPASWGQYLGGTPHGHPPGTLFDHHWIGKVMKNKNFKVRWIIDEKGRKIPLLYYMNKEHKFANLHIHTKNLFKYC